MRAVNCRSEWCQQSVQLSAGHCVAVGSVPASKWNGVHESNAVVEVRVTSNISSRSTSSWIDCENGADLLDDKRLCSNGRINDCSEIQNGQVKAGDEILTVEGEESSFSEIVDWRVGVVEEQIDSDSNFVAICNQSWEVEDWNESSAG